MPRKLSSFLIRWWRGEDDERLEVEHIQSGHRRLASSASDALIWMSDEADAQEDREGRADSPQPIEDDGERGTDETAVPTDSDAS